MQAADAVARIISDQIGTEIMETFPLAKEGEDAAAFEVENAYVSRRTIASLLEQAEGISDVRLCGRFGSTDDVRIEFKYLGRSYIVWEPFGDNSRYWIGPKNREERAEGIAELEEVFKRYQPPFYRALLGDLLTLRMFRRKAGHH